MRHATFTDAGLQSLIGLARGLDDRSEAASLAPKFVASHPQQTKVAPGLARNPDELIHGRILRLLWHHRSLFECAQSKGRWRICKPRHRSKLRIPSARDAFQKSLDRSIIADPTPTMGAAA
jgi:hypothetical protein